MKVYTYYSQTYLANLKRKQEDINRAEEAEKILLERGIEEYSKYKKAIGEIESTSEGY